MTLTNNQHTNVQGVELACIWEYFRKVDNEPSKAECDLIVS